MTSLLERLPVPLVALLVLGVVLAPPLAADVAIVCDKSTPVDSLDAAQARALWLGTIERIGGVKLSVVDRSDAEIRDLFYRRLLNKTRGQIKAIRAKRAFQYGIAPPPALPTDDSVLRWVRAGENRLGYVDAETVAKPEDVPPEGGKWKDPLKILLIVKVPKRSEEP